MGIPTAILGHEPPGRHRPREVGFAPDSCLDADVADTAACDPLPTSAELAAHRPNASRTRRRRILLVSDTHNRVVPSDCDILQFRMRAIWKLVAASTLWLAPACLQAASKDITALEEPSNYHVLRVVISPLSRLQIALSESINP